MTRDRTAVDVKMLLASLPDDVNFSAWCKRLGVSRQTGYKWRNRYRLEGEAGLQERSRAAKQPAGRLDAAVEDDIVVLRKELGDGGWDAGPESIQWHLAQLRGQAPSRATIWRVLVRRGQLVPEPRKRPKTSLRRFERDRPNECWQIDDTAYPLADGTEVRIVNIIDDCSRLAVASRVTRTCTAIAAWETMQAAIAAYGVPQEVLSDNGRAFTGRAGTDSLFGRNLHLLGVHTITSSPYHPQTCGKVERFHQTQKRWLDAHDPPSTIAELQDLADRFRADYNQRRPHRALGRRTPAEVWAAQRRAAPARTVDQPDARIHTGLLVGKGGTVFAGLRLAIGVGAPWIGCRVNVIVNGPRVVVMDSTTFEVIRDFEADPTRRYHPTGAKRGGPRQPRRNRQP